MRKINFKIAKIILVGGLFCFVIIVATSTLAIRSIFKKYSVKITPKIDNAGTLNSTSYSGSSTLTPISQIWETFDSKEGFTIRYPSNWYLSVNNTENPDGGKGSYYISNISRSSIEQYNTIGQEYINVRFYVMKSDFTSVKIKLEQYYDRHPDSSTFLFLGDTPAKYSEKNIRIGEHKAVKFEIAPESQEQEQTIEQILIELDSNHVLNIRRLLSDNSLSDAQMELIDKTYEEIIGSIYILN